MFQVIYFNKGSFGIWSHFLFFLKPSESKKTEGGKVRFEKQRGDRRDVFLKTS